MVGGKGGAGSGEAGCPLLFPALPPRAPAPADPPLRLHGLPLIFPPFPDTIAVAEGVPALGRRRSFFNSSTTGGISLAAYDYLVVGAGLFGAVFTREALDLGKKVLVIDQSCR